MKWYWHLLTLIVATVATWFTSTWLNEPLWQITQQGPVSFDRCNTANKEWSTLVGDADRKNWWLETRSGRDATVIRKLALDLPPLTSEFPYFGSTIGLLHQPGDVMLCHEYIRSNNPKSGGSIEMRYCILDPTGLVLRRFTVGNNPLGKIAGHASRLAFAGSGLVHLFDVSTKVERSVKIGSVFDLAFSPDGTLLACIDQQSNSFCFIDWENAVLIKPIKPSIKAVSFCFVDNNTIFLEDRETIKRWRWDGTSMKQISPGINMTSKNAIPRVKQSPTGELDVSMTFVKDWPLQLKSVLQWLEDKKFPVERWFPKQHYWSWYVLDEQDHIIRHYYEREKRQGGQLFDHLFAEVVPKKQFTSATITLWNENPTWPNAAAVGVMIYLLLYTLKRIVFP